MLSDLGALFVLTRFLWFRIHKLATFLTSDGMGFSCFLLLEVLLFALNIYTFTEFLHSLEA